MDNSEDKPGQYQLLESVVVPPLSSRERLSDFVAGKFVMIPSRKGMKKAIVKGLVFVNERRGTTGDWVTGGERIDLYRPVADKPAPVIDLKLEVIFEDDHLAVVRKPAGIEVSGNRARTLEHALPMNLKSSKEADALLSPQPVHRLDYPTSGLLIVAKTQRALINLNRAFSDRLVEKMYTAVVIGELKGHGEIKEKIDGLEAQTTYRVLQRVPSERFGELCLIELFPHTGRRHQLRKHLSALGNPILGDALYGKPGLILKGKGLYLHATRLSFNHPETGNLVEVICQLPATFQKLFRANN